MSPKQRHIIFNNNTNYEESHAISKPTITAFISTKIMETNAEKESVRQKSQTIYFESTLVKDKETKGQEETASPCEIMENETIGYAPTDV